MFVAAVVLCAGSTAVADVVSVAPLERPGIEATLAQPLRLRAGQQGRIERPSWTRAALWSAPPLARLARVERPGTPVFDPSTDAWYAPANGALVELRADGTLPVVFCCLQGRDVDVRAARRIAVSREPDDTIVLWRWTSPRSAQRRVLLRGDQLFNPRLSPDGSQVIVSEARAGRAQMLLVSLDGEVQQLGRGDDPAWHPDGLRIVFTRVADDGHQLTGAELWSLDVPSRQSAMLGSSRLVAALRPVVSPDGRFVAFVDGKTGDLYGAALPARGR